MCECVICREAITNPICAECTEQEIRTWLYDVKPELVNELRRITEELNLRCGETSCIICKNSMSICSFCYLKHISNWLEEYPGLLKEFNNFFNLKYYA